MNSAASGKTDQLGELSIEEDRYSRLRIIPWWDQDLLRRSKVMVVGAGALGNEILKDLALLGVGSILIVDFDAVETSNLSRSVLYRMEDDGKSKAHAAAAAVRAINPDCTVFAVNADVSCEIGLGVFRWADVVICGLDNRHARMAVNAACWKVNRPWVDGATESFQGVARVFRPPDGVCYECTLSETDIKLLNVRNSCGFLAKEAIGRGRTPTTPTTSAVIAGIEVQEAIKLLHSSELPGLVGKGFFFDGNTYDCFTIEYVRRDDCLSHETYETIIETDLASETATPNDVLALAAERLAGRVVLDMPGEMVTELRCRSCETGKPFFRLLDTMDQSEAVCPDCGEVRIPNVVAECEPGSAFASIPLAKLGFGIMDVIAARNENETIGIEISGDRKALFGA
jgi:molybdopterin/thiamine biosynthesis adenylyltransferase